MSTYLEVAQRLVALHRMMSDKFDERWDPETGDPELADLAGDATERYQELKSTGMSFTESSDTALAEAYAVLIERGCPNGG